jgi:uncharacterized protein YciI
MFIIELIYKKEMSEVERFLEPHRAFIDKYMTRGILLASGPKIPRDGGVILANGLSRNELEELVKEDPFWIQEIAHYKITEFTVTKQTAQFKF